MAFRNRMVKVVCKAKPIGDIRTRQPKQPGQKPAEWNRAPQTVPAPPEEVWANCTRAGHARCVRCGGLGHEEVAS